MNRRGFFATLTGAAAAAAIPVALSKDTETWKCPVYDAELNQWSIGWMERRYDDPRTMLMVTRDGTVHRIKMD